MGVLLGTDRWVLRGIDAKCLGFLEPAWPPIEQESSSGDKKIVKQDMEPKEGLLVFLYPIYVLGQFSFVQCGP